jgi:DNA-binding winged helix-turn-helix (wHTH) protein
MSGTEVRSTIEFLPFRLDLRSGCLLRDERPVPLRPKTWALLQYLAERPGLLVSKDELVAGVWGHRAVSDDAISRTLGELRRVLEDDAREPRIIQTVHRRGFRFIAPITEARATADRVPTPTGSDRADAGILVGRDHETSSLESSFQLACAGHRQIVFVTGEAGAGKTAVVEAFVHAQHGAAPLRIATGRCIELFGEREVLTPALEVFETLAGVDPDERMIAQVRGLAPSWLAQMRSFQLAGDSDLVVQVPTTMTGPHRMRREFAALLEAVSAGEPLVIVFEDLQWADHGTVDLLSILAQRREPARLMIVGTCRIAEAAVRGNAIAQLVPTLHARQLAAVIALENLTRDDVAEYLRRRLASPVEKEVAPLVHERIGGNPLLMVALVDHLLASGALIAEEDRWRLVPPAAANAVDIPDDLRQLLENQLGLATDLERDLLGAASVAGTMFDSREIAAALHSDVHDVESSCDRLCRVPRMLRPLGTERWPDGSVAGRYAFIQSAYQRVIYDRIAPARRAAWHRRIGERVLNAYAGRTTNVASELGVHFQRGHDRRAVIYLAECARHAYTRHGYREARDAIEAALSMLAQMPAASELESVELGLRLLYGTVLAQLHGYAADGLRANLARTLVLAQDAGDPAARFEALYMLGTMQANECALAAASETGLELTRLAEVAAIPAPCRAQYVAGVAALWMGDLQRAEPLLAAVRAASSAMEPGTPWFGVDPAAGAAIHESLRSWLLGQHDRAQVLRADAIVTAERLENPFTLAFALTSGSAICALSGQWDDAERFATRAIAIADEHQFVRWRATALVCRGRALVERGHLEPGLHDMRYGLQLLEEANLRLGGSLLHALHASACVRVERQDEGLAAVDGGLALCRDTTERLFEAELWRLKGELLLRSADARRSRSASHVAARQHFLRAFQLARAQGALSLERAARVSARRLIRANVSRAPG